MTLEQEIVVVGNPLLDISAEVTASFLSKYGLEANNAILAEEKHQGLYADLVASFPVEYIAGGAAQNTARGIQWMLQRPNATTYFGCVGKDAYAETMRSAAAKEGLAVRYLEDPATPTGTCAVLITENSRSLVANLAAANNYKPDHIVAPDNWAVVEKARLFYISGFFLTVSPDTIQLVAKHAAEKNKVFVMNLSAPFLCQFFQKPMIDALPYVDILFGNESEAAAFAEANNLGTKDVKEIALKIAAMPKINAARPRMVVFTQGADATIVAYNGAITEYPVIPIKSDDIVDTNGAGDAFVGGFLSQFAQSKSTEDCIRGGNFLANVIIQRSGASYPAERPDFI